MADDINATECGLLTTYPVIPERLTAAEYVLVRFQLDLLEPVFLDTGTLFSLRGALRRAGREVLGERVDSWFDPPLSSDPAALKRFQKAAPAFVLRPELVRGGEWLEGDHLELEVLFLGTGITSLGDFCRIMQALGMSGLAAGKGRFELTGVTCLGSDGNWRLLRWWGSKALPAPELLSLGEWLDGRLPIANPILEFLAPARMVTGGRVLRQPRFAQLFPFLLRRVTSMLYYHCGMEPVDDPAPLLSSAARIEARWLEVRRQEGFKPGAEVANGRTDGLTGRLLLDGAGLQELLWVVALATLFGIGKGAAWGSGRCRLAEAMPADIL
jgi:hypothetical protein